MMKYKTQILGIATVTFLASCSPKEKTNEGSLDSKVDSTSMPADSLAKAPADSLTKPYADTAHNSQNSVDWNGTYEATVPCADCPGIKTSLTLNKDNTFAITEEYIDKKSKSDDKGTFEWNKEGSIITLNGKNSKYKYQVGENKLIQLDMEGKEITGPSKDLYVFKKK
ncbi:putative lipoprotein NlpE involved in copper resistance [Chryseobacterium sp. H1D6B]|uniref:copper resistance protein NlpE n=1 Tax=Chryseobacterium sp. H1D6B TaxID=2940588 RepID=UPI0017ED49CF|nr:copper resistance protein NlpE [Chryseobacterium sp. H1D6B]MDH6252829.1 putative lipoprotein NlpE involved in copper resistance [Chryseobacterium sp. H1D6B]